MKKTNINNTAIAIRGGIIMKGTSEMMTNKMYDELTQLTCHGGRQGDLDGGTWHGGRQGDLDGGTWHGGRQGDLDGGTWHGGRQGDLDGGTWHGGRQGDLDGGTWHGITFCGADVAKKMFCYGKCLWCDEVSNGGMAILSGDVCHNSDGRKQVVLDCKNNRIYEDTVSST